MKKILLSVSGVLSFIIFLVLYAVAAHIGNRQLEQQMASRWSAEKDVAQISCFFSKNAAMSEYTIQSFEHTLDIALEEASIIQTSENANARLWADAYSADGRISISSDRASLEADAIGIGGDFFLFHPLPLLSGSYFSGNDLMQDYCVLDEDAAWQLFGSNDVAGMRVTIGGVPHIVTGVVERPKGKLAEAAGLDTTLVYVSYQTLSTRGSNNGINHYEVVMPNPVSDFAYNMVKEKIGVQEKDVEIVENTSRYSLLSGVKILGELGTRSMNGKAIIYPYWENIARGYEDIFAVLTLCMLLFLAYPVGMVVVLLLIKWKHRSWTLKSVWLMVKDKIERRMEKCYYKKQERKKSKK